MRYKIVERKVNLKDATKEYFYQKIGKFDKVFTDETSAVATFYSQKDKIFLEVTIKTDGMIMRAETFDKDAKAAIDKASDIIDGQMRKYKTKISKKLKKAYVPENTDEEIPEVKEFNIVKTKQFFVKPMSVEEAVLQMKLLNHQFFVFKDDNDNTRIVYCRKDGDYGLIEIS